MASDRNKNKFLTVVASCLALVLLLLGVDAARAFNPVTYQKPFNGTLTAAEWNNLPEDFLKKFGAVELGSSTTTGNSLLVHGPVTATTFIGSLMASNVSSGEFGTNYGYGDFFFGATGPGNVGIGTTNATVKLTLQHGNQPYTQLGAASTWDMAFGIAANTDKISGMDFKNFNASGQVRLMARNNQNDYLVMNMLGSTNSTSFFGQTGANAATIFSYGWTDSDKKLTLGTYNAGDLILGTNNAERMRIFANGAMNIGTTTPGSFRLSVGAPISGSSSISAGSYRISNVMDPDLNTDAATKGYVLSVIPGAPVSYWNLSGNSLTASSTAWNVGIGTTTPGTSKLRVVGPVDIHGDINMNGGHISNLEKLTVNTIDPLYRIKGINYSTFVSAIVGGVTEEYVGRIDIKDKRPGGYYEKVIDFTKQPEGSDLWVWRHTVDFSEKNVETFITPYGVFARTYFLIEDEKLILRSDKPISASYRLIGRRIDWKKWPLKSEDQDETPGFIID